MTAETKGRDLFIVDNSVSGWTGLRYLEEWSGIAKAFDIATGYFEIGALLALDGKWQGLEKIRILMGAEMTHRTRKALLEAVRTRALEIRKAPDSSKLLRKIFRLQVFKDLFSWQFKPPLFLFFSIQQRAYKEKR